MNKKAVRRGIAEQLNELENRQERERRIAERLFLLPEWMNATSIAVTLSFRNECSTDRIIQQAWADGKRVVIPKVIDQEMRFFEHSSSSRLIENSMGILEPELSAFEIPLPTIDLCIVPGRAYMRNGYRLGWGGGFYDRALIDFSGPTLSIAFAVQVVERFEVESFDRPVDTIVTEDEVIQCH